MNYKGTPYLLHNLSLLIGGVASYPHSLFYVTRAYLISIKPKSIYIISTITVLKAHDRRRHVNIFHNKLRH